MAFSSGIEGDGDAPMATINVTPLVDVMLVMLVIFMVTAPMLQQGVEVSLPKATTAPLQGTAEQIVVSIDKSGKIYVGSGNEVSLEDLGKRMASIMESRPQDQRKVYIKSDAGIEYGRVMQVMGQLHASGITQIGLVSAQPE